MLSEWLTWLAVGRILVNGVLHLRYRYSASPSSLLSERASVTCFQVGFIDFWSHTSSMELRHSSSVSLFVKISSSRSSSIASSSPSFCHLGVTVGCSSVRRVSSVRGLTRQAAMVEHAFHVSTWFYMTWNKIMYIQVCIQGGSDLLLRIPSEGEVNNRPVLFIISSCPMFVALAQEWRKGIKTGME